MAEPRTDALYVKLKTNSLFTVNRETVDFMAEHLAQDTTFVTHFALARLRDDILSGRLASSKDVSVVASEWISTDEVDAVRDYVERKFKPAGLTWTANSPKLADALGRM
ncbi:MAG: hypothetical protein H7346_18610 [Burkholderiaceae bacterium]|nr:hypothetical protein [Burkholderiaceae bacterium]